MNIRFVTNNENKNNYELLTVISVSDCDTIIKMLVYMKEQSIPLEINTADIADTDGEEYYIEDIRFVVPTIGGEIQEYISVLVQ